MAKRKCFNISGRKLHIRYSSSLEETYDESTLITTQYQTISTGTRLRHNFKKIHNNIRLTQLTLAAAYFRSSLGDAKRHEEKNV